MEEKNELGDIILNKGSKQGGNKKIILAAATLGIILIVVVLLMNTLNSDNENNLPQSALPPKPLKEEPKASGQKEEPLFEDVEVIEEDTPNKENAQEQKLEEIAQKLKAKNEGVEPPKVEEVNEPVVSHEKAHTEKQKVKRKENAQLHAKRPLRTVTHKAKHGNYYIQVGSFSKYKPNKHFLASIKKAGFEYTFHKAIVHGRHVTKVLVGPFQTEKEARRALAKVRKSIEKHAFLTRLKG